MGRYRWPDGSQGLFWHAVRMDEIARVDHLLQAKEWYKAAVSPSYDEVLREVSCRAEETESLGKLDIGALLAWKRLRADTKWMRGLMATPETVVREHTGEAFRWAREPDLPTPEAAGRARSALSPLDGFRTGDALASAVCVALAPERLAVYDSRAHRGLELLGFSLSNKPGRYRTYMELVEQCRAELAGQGHEWSAREVDLALFQLGQRVMPTTKG